MGGDHAERTIVHIRGPGGGVNFKEIVTEDNNVPSPAEERRTHDSSWEDDLYEPVRSLDHRLTTDLTSLAGGLK